MNCFHHDLNHPLSRTIFGLQRSDFNQCRGKEKWEIEVFSTENCEQNGKMTLLTNVYLKWADWLNLFSFFSYHYTVKVEWLLLSVPPKIWALLPQWEMSLRGGLADTLLPVSGVPWASKQVGAERCWPGPQQAWKVWANEAICQDIVPSGPRPATCFGGPLAATHGETDTHSRVQICCRRNWVLWCLTYSKAVSVQC